MDIHPDLKYALIIGINYRGTSSQLNGCINDALAMRDYLINVRGYRSDHIVLMHDDTDKKPTAANILYELGQLILKSHKRGAKELYLHYSGHGSYTKDLSGDEKDHRDETIVPIDYNRSGMITDDKLHDYVDELAHGSRMICLFDCCHSGTILDLKYRYEGYRQNFVENPQSVINGNIIMISGCRDDQTSADAWIKGHWAGAMTTSFLACVGKSDTCYELLENMRAYLKAHRYSQHPRLCCTDPLDDSVKFPK